MADTQDIEQDEIDTTEEKAKAIGKEIGVADHKSSEDIPDYDIQEEPDERIAKEREPRIEKTERKQLSNKEKRQLRKQKISNLIDSKDAEIIRLKDENEQIKRWQQNVNSQLDGINKAEVDKAWDANINAFNKAEKDHADAFTEGDGAKATRAMREMYNAQRNIDQLQSVKQRIDKPVAQQPVQQSNQADPVVVHKAKTWAERNTWYNPNGTDVDSEIAKAISGVLANEGYDPKTDDFWDELDDRLSEKQIVPDEEDEPAPKTVRKRTAPPLSGGANRGDLNGKKTITLPTSYINMLKANGIWDDVGRRNKIIADRERILRESGN